ncbi:caspase family protein [Massilia sp. W12]|uniref:caspase family protein n=1 Tax=Massilia sp. W12 TaxID=3126507 RepID=UPI0030CBC3B0
MKTYALCLGVNHYLPPFARLRCSESDASGLAHHLTRLADCQAHNLEQYDAAAILYQLAQLGGQMRPGDRLIFYFSGHACLHNGEYCLMLPGSHAELLARGEESEVLCWSALQAVSAHPAWQGVQRIFIFDTALPAPAPACIISAENSDTILLCSSAADKNQLEQSQHFGMFCLALQAWLSDSALAFDAAAADALRRHMQAQHADIHPLPDVQWCALAPAARAPVADWLRALQDGSLDALQNYVAQAALLAPQVKLARQLITLHKRQAQDEANWRALQTSHQARDWAGYLQSAPPESPYRRQAQRQLTQLRADAHSRRQRLLGGSLLLGALLLALLLYALWQARSGQMDAPGAPPPAQSGRGELPGPNPHALPALPDPNGPPAPVFNEAQDAAQAQYAMALQYLQGELNAHKRRQAMALLHKAALQGHALAQISLGNLYESTPEGKDDLRQAALWYGAAAQQGNALGQFHLGQMYEKGLGVAADAALAQAWYELAAAQGLPQAQQALARRR